MRYEYNGPNGRYFPHDVTERSLAQIRARLHSIGIPDARIVTQLSPYGRRFVRVDAPGTARNDSIVAAITGPDTKEQDSVLVAPLGASCGDEPELIMRALDVATSRGKRIAEALHATFDAKPIAVMLTRRDSLVGCNDLASLSLPVPIARPISGRLAVFPTDRDQPVQVVATFQISTIPSSTASSMPSPHPTMPSAMRRALDTFRLPWTTLKRRRPAVRSCKRNLHRRA